MELLVVVMGILLVTVLVVGVGDRFNLPWPVLLTLATAALIFVPGVPSVDLDPELILPIFLPPLLWALGQRASWQMFRTNWRSIVVYSVILVALTILAVTWTSLVFLPGITVASAVAIGAATAPPDPVAVEAVAEPVGIPRRIVATLQTEGLFNDAVSLVTFQAALASIVAGGHLAPGTLALQFVYTALVAVLIGLAVGWLGVWALRRITDRVGRSALTLIIPFAVYLFAEEVHASGVIAVVVAAVQVSSSKGDLDAADRLAGAAFWEVLEMMMTGLAFGLIGLQVREAIDDAGDRIWEMVLHGVIISAVVILVRLFWMSGIAVLSKRSKNPRYTPHSFGEGLVMTWAGMRGLVTLALALSLPTVNFAFRAEAQVIAVVVLLFTMVFPGLTLPTLVSLLGLGSEPQQDKRERELMERGRRAAMASLSQFADDAPPEVVMAVSDMYRRIVPRRPDEHGSEEEYHHQLEEQRRRMSMFETIRAHALRAAQDEVISARRDRGVDPETVDRVLHRLDQMEASTNPEMSAILPVLNPPTTAK